MLPLLLSLLRLSVCLSEQLSLSWGIYIIGAVLHGELLSLLATFIPFLFMMPTYLIMFPIFSFMNVNDISWGTKDRRRCTLSLSVCR